jgi:hypothetical protein
MLESSPGFKPGLGALFRFALTGPDAYRMPVSISMSSTDMRRRETVAESGL